MQAITTKSYGPTNTLPSRVKATAQAGNLIVEWDSALNYERNHAAAAHALASKLDWRGQWIGGGLPGGGMVWVCATDTRDSFSVIAKEQPQ